MDGRAAALALTLGCACGRSTSPCPNEGQVHADDGGCVSCMRVEDNGNLESGDLRCAKEHPEVDLPCRMLCDTGYCQRFCPGECSYDPAGGCAPGDGQCVFVLGPHPALPGICDTACGAAGGCRRCMADDECKAEIGAGAVCARPCRVCCVPGEASPVPCPSCN